MRRGLAPLLQPPDQPAGVVAAIAGQDIAPDDISCTTLTATGTIRAGAASSIGFTGRSILSSASDGVVLLSNAAGTDFSRLQFGGTTSSFPALARSSTELFVRLADDSNFAGLRCALITGSNDIFAGSAAGRAIGFASSSRLKNSADGTILLTNAASSDFSLLQLGGTTSSFPALKRSSAAMQCRLADDSAYAAFTASTITANGASVTASLGLNAFTGTAIPAGGTTGSGIRVSSTTNFGVFFGSGAPSLSAAQGSLYLRSDGSGTANRLYVNTDGGTTWTNFVTAG